MWKLDFLVDAACAFKKQNNSADFIGTTKPPFNAHDSLASVIFTNSCDELA